MQVWAFSRLAVERQINNFVDNNLKFEFHPIKMWASLVKGHKGNYKIKNVRMELENIPVQKVSISKCYQIKLTF